MDKRELLISLRKDCNWKQKDVVVKLKEKYDIEITISYYGMIEQGIRTPKLELAIAISSLFDKTPEEIFLNTKTTKCCFCGKPLEKMGVI